MNSHYALPMNRRQLELVHKALSKTTQQFDDVALSQDLQAVIDSLLAVSQTQNVFNVLGYSQRVNEWVQLFTWRRAPVLGLEEAKKLNEEFNGHYSHFVIITRPQETIE